VAEWSIEKLGNHHDRKDFDCGKQPLTDWLKRLAGQNEERDISRTFVVVRPGESRVFGYYSLSSYSIRYEDVPPKRAKNLPRSQPIPTALLGRLAVDKSVQGQRLGTLLLMDAFRQTLRLTSGIAIHAIVVHAIDEEARGFYLKRSFEPLLDDPLHLYITMKVVRQLDLEP
jgi:GNAT superfamily N-acetyltransferase